MALLHATRVVLASFRMSQVKAAARNAWREKDVPMKRVVPLSRLHARHVPLAAIRTCKGKAAASSARQGDLRPREAPFRALFARAARINRWRVKVLAFCAPQAKQNWARSPFLAREKHRFVRLVQQDVISASRAKPSALPAIAASIKTQLVKSSALVAVRERRNRGLYFRVLTKPRSAQIVRAESTSQKLAKSNVMAVRAADIRLPAKPSAHPAPLENSALQRQGLKVRRANCAV